MPPVSLIMTVYNEAATIAAVLHSLKNQSYQPAEIVIVDGGSTDGTPTIIEQTSKELNLKVRCIVLAGANISQGRNYAISAASHPIIAATDAGVRLPPDWLEKLVEPFQNPNCQVVAGFFRADPNPQSAFEVAMGATVLPSEADINPSKFLPSSRSVAFSKAAWEKVGGYPEWLDYCEDLVFDLNLKAAGYEFVWQPQAVAWFAPRQSLKAFWRQYYRYARGDGKANLFFKRHALRYIVYGILLPVLVGLSRKRLPLLGVLLLAGMGYVWKAYRRLFQQWHILSKPSKFVLAMLYVPIIRAVGDIAKMTGYPVGTLVEN